METYILDDDEVGQRFAEALLAKQAQGVQVNLIRDSVGTVGTPPAFFERVAASGVRALEFNPINPLAARKAWSLNQRDHRKLLIVDGHTAFLGGINISSVYSGGSFKRGSRARPAGGASASQDLGPAWRDTDLRLRGPVVADLQKAVQAPLVALFPSLRHPERNRTRHLVRLHLSSEAAAVCWALTAQPRIGFLEHHPRNLAFGARTPWNRMRCSLGLGTRAASRCMNFSGDITRWVVPLVRQAALALDWLSRRGEFTISTTAGERPISVRTVAGWARSIVADSIEDFQLKRIRSGIETLLAASGVSREVRGHLQSHGLTGVQARHHDGHDYMPEKRSALEVLLREVGVGEDTAPDSPFMGSSASILASNGDKIGVITPGSQWKQS
jgi:hypothetical protein